MNMPKELQEIVLLFGLNNGESHGYELAEFLHQNHFDVDLATVYRKLQSMERRGLITSRWEPSVSGPARRVYSISSQGSVNLRSGFADLSILHSQMGDLLNFAKASFKKHAQSEALSSS